MYKKKGITTRRCVALFMTMLMLAGQFQNITYASVQTEDTQQKSTSESGEEDATKSDAQSPDVKPNDSQEKVQQEVETNAEANAEYEKYKSWITSNREGFDRNLGPAGSFGIFVNGLFTAKSEFEADIAVKKLYSLVTPKVTFDLGTDINYIQHFADEDGNILKKNPLPVDYNMKGQKLILGNGYQIVDDLYTGKLYGIGYGIDGKLLGYPARISVLQDPSDDQFVDFDSEFRYLNTLSSELASLATTNTATILKNGTTMELHSESEIVDVFNLSGADFLNDSEMNINLSGSDATCIINVDMTDIKDFDWNSQVTLVNGGTREATLYDIGKKLWNFYTTEINENGELIYKPYDGKIKTNASIYGIFLAPSASVEVGAGNFTGSIISKELVSNTSKIIQADFTGMIHVEGTKKSEKNSEANNFDLNEEATYTGDYNSENNTGKRTYQLDLSATEVTQMAEKPEQTLDDTGMVSDATVKEYLSDYFVLTTECKAKLDKMENVSYGYNKTCKRWFVEWKNQTIPIEEKWTATIEVEAKSEFIGGNDIVTSASESGIFIDDKAVAKFPKSKVNVPVKFSVGKEEATIQKGKTIPIDLYNSYAKKNEYVQTRIYNQYATPDIFVGNKATGKFSYKWYWKDKLVGEGKSLESLVTGVVLDNDTELILKVTFEPYNTNTTADGQKGLAKVTTHLGNYLVHVTNSKEKNLWRNETITYTGNYNAQDNSEKRTFLVKFAANTQQVTAPEDIVIVLDRSDKVNDIEFISKDYIWPKAKEIVEGERYYVIDRKINSYSVQWIEKDENNEYFYDNHWDRRCDEYIKRYVDKNDICTGPPSRDAYRSQLDQVKKDAINLVNSLKESSPDSNICVISSNIEGVTNDTNGFKNVSSDTESIINAINGITANGKARQDLGLQEAYNVLNQNNVKSNGREKTVVLFATDVPRTSNNSLDYNAYKNALNYSNLLKKEIHANVYTAKIDSYYTKEQIFLDAGLLEIASSGTSASDKKANLTYNYEDVFEDIYDEVTDGIANATMVEYLNEHFQFTERTMKAFNENSNVSYGFDEKRNQWYVKCANQIIPTNNSIWLEQIEIEAKDDFVGGNNIPVNGVGSGIYVGDKKLKDFPSTTVDVPVKSN